LIYIDKGVNITDVFGRVIGTLLWDPKAAVDLTKSPSIYSYNNLLMADSCEFELNLASVGFTKNRWARFLTQYIDKEELETWLQSINNQRRGVINLLRSTGDTKITPSLFHPDKMGHRWGVCFLGTSFQITPEPRLTLYSRTARIPTTASMELTLISLLAKEIKKRYHINKHIRFTWFCAGIHVTAYDAMPYLIYRKQMQQFLRSELPLARFVNRQYEKAQRLPATPEAIPYGRQRRIIRRVQEMEAGEFLPECQVSKLSLWSGRK